MVIVDVRPFWLDNVDGTFTARAEPANSNISTPPPARPGIGYSIGALDIPNSVFPTHEDALDYYYPTLATSVIDGLNFVYGSINYSIGNRVEFYTDYVTEFASKQDQATILDNLSSATIGNGELLAIDSSGNAVGMSVTDVAQDVLASPSFAAMKSTMLIGTAANFDESHFALTTHTHDASAVVSGTLDAARIPSLAISKVTGLQSAIDGKFANPTGNTSQYLRGDGTVAMFPTTAARSFGNPTRSLNTAFQISASRDAAVSYAVDVSASLSLSGGQVGTVVLEYADDSGFTTNVVTVLDSANGNSGTLTIGLGLTQLGTMTVSGIVPAAKYVRLRTVNTSGTPTFTFKRAQEVLL